MKTLFTSQAANRSGRSGTITTPDFSLHLSLSNPLDPAALKGGPTPETLFAAAYAACYHGALLNAAERLHTPVKDTVVNAQVSLNEDDADGFGLSVELHATLPGVNRTKAQEIMEAAHQTCPFSKALRGEAPVKLVVD